MDASKRRNLIGVLLIAFVFLAALAGTGYWLVRNYAAKPKDIVLLTSVPAAGTPSAPGVMPPAAGGAPIGGIVRNPEGNPVAGARLTFNWRVPAGPNDPNGLGMQVKRGNATTDALGHWTSSAVPTNALDTVSFSVTQRDYVATNPGRVPAKQLQDQTAVFTLSRGVDVSGIVVDAAGKPVNGAQVSLGANRGTNSPTATSDADGKFTLHRLRPGATETITSIYTGLAPGAVQVHIAATNDPVRLVMTAGRTITGKVTDKSGDPMSGVSISINQWNGNFMGGMSRVTTNGRGEYTLADAPMDQLQLEASKSGYVGDIQQAAPAENTRNFTVSPQLTMFGSVVDATTHQPIDKFTVDMGARFSGNEAPSFNGGGQTFTGGHYQQTLTGYIGNVDSWYLRIEAKGYLPATSPPLHESGTQDFELQPGKDLVGRVLTADGKPAAGVSVGISNPGQNLYVSDGQLQGQRGSGSVTDAQGHFDLPPQSGKYMVVAVGAAGSARADQDALARSPDMTLSDWGTIEGTLTVGGKPAADQRISANASEDFYDQNAPMVQFGYNAQTDAQGHFTLNRVLPGDVSVSRLVQAPGQTYFTSDSSEIVTVEAGKTATVNLGANGRTVTGSAELPADASSWGEHGISANLIANVTMPPNPMPADIQKKTPQEQQKWWNDFYKTDAGKAYRKAQRAIRNYNQQIGADGKFTFGAVAPGDYRLSINVYPRQGGATLAGGQAVLTVTPLAPGNSDKPIEIPPIKVISIKHLKMGDAAPEMTAIAQDGKPLKLSDFSGKYVLLSFGTNRTPGEQAAAQNLKDVYSACQTDDRLVILEVMVGNEPRQPDTMPAAGGAAWRQSTLKPDPQTMSWVQQWSIQTVPAIFLISPDGKVLARDLKGEAILTAVQSALKPAP